MKSSSAFLAARPWNSLSDVVPFNDPNFPKVTPQNEPFVASSTICRSKDDITISSHSRENRPNRFNATLPPPQKVPPQCPSMGRALISTQYPYKILSATEQLCDRLGYTEAEMASMSIKLLSGPDTDPFAIASAVKGVMAAGEVTKIVIPRLLVYNRWGKAEQAQVSCIGVRDNRGVEACSLRFDWHTRLPRPQISWSLSGPPMTRGSPLARAELAGRSIRPRGQYNFLTGLEIQRELQHASAAHQRSASEEASAHDL
jgi:hypothetical protein